MRYGQRLDARLLASLPDFASVEQDVTIAAERLAASGYFKHFAHHLCGVGAIPPDRYRAAMAAGTDAGPLDQTGLYLTPAACLNLYPTLFERGRETSLCRLTSLARVFRNERDYSRYRSQEFVVREFLFYGARDSVLSAIEPVARAVMEAIVVRRGSLGVSIASDSFVPLPVGRLMEHNQLKAQVKREFVLDAVPIAIGSINVHDDHFMKSHGVVRDGFITACIGVGLTRVEAAGEDGIIDIAED